MTDNLENKSEEQRPRDMTNKELANAYFDAVAPYSNDWEYRRYSKQRDAIINSEINISDFYNEHKSIEDLFIPEMNQNTKQKLHSILRFGPEKIKKKMESTKVNKLQRSKGSFARV